MASAASRGFNRLRKLAKEIPPEDKVLKLMYALMDANHHAADRAAAIVGATLIESALETAILAKFVPLNQKTERPNLFDGERNGPLATFSARIRIAYALGIFGPRTRDELECIKAIRNAFVHGAMRLKFSTPEISDICKHLSLYKRLTLASGGGASVPKDIFLFTISYIAGELRAKIEKPRSYLALYANQMSYGGLP